MKLEFTCPITWVYPSTALCAPHLDPRAPHAALCYRACGYMHADACMQKYLHAVDLISTHHCVPYVLPLPLQRALSHIWCALAEETVARACEGGGGLPLRAVVAHLSVAHGGARFGEMRHMLLALLRWVQAERGMGMGGSCSNLHWTFWLVKIVGRKEGRAKNGPFMMRAGEANSPGGGRGGQPVPT